MRHNNLHITQLRNQMQTITSILINQLKSSILGCVVLKQHIIDRLNLHIFIFNNIPYIHITQTFPEIYQVELIAHLHLDIPCGIDVDILYIDHPFTISKAYSPIFILEHALNRVQG